MPKTRKSHPPSLKAKVAVDRTETETSSCSVLSLPEICPMRDQRRRYDSNEFAPKRGYYVCFPLNSWERLFEPDCLAPQT